MLKETAKGSGGCVRGLTKTNPSCPGNRSRRLQQLRPSTDRHIMENSLLKSAVVPHAGPEG
jgi:hypothetical protein